MKLQKLFISLSFLLGTMNLNAIEGPYGSKEQCEGAKQSDCQCFYHSQPPARSGIDIRGGIPDRMQGMRNGWYCSQQQVLN